VKRLKSDRRENVSGIGFIRTDYSRAEFARLTTKPTTMWGRQGDYSSKDFVTKKMEVKFLDYDRRK
jgi:hypothetical protein